MGKFSTLLEQYVLQGAKPTLTHVGFCIHMLRSAVSNGKSHPRASFMHDTGIFKAKVRLYPASTELKNDIQFYLLLYSDEEVIIQLST